ncbi:MAG: SAM-dependent methyltransferase [Candidatus Poriferisodalaceae bacterium]
MTARFAAHNEFRSSEATEFLDRFLLRLELDSRVADLGCGPGNNARLTAATGHTTVGCDRSIEMLNLASTHCHGARTDLRYLPFADDSLDASWSAAGFTTSLGGDEDWELVPTAPHRVPDIAEDGGRRFVHHDETELLNATGALGWAVHERSIRSSHRN